MVGHAEMNERALTVGSKYSITYTQGGSTNSIVGEYVEPAYGNNGIRIKVRHELMGRVWHTHRNIRWRQIQKIV